MPAGHQDAAEPTRREAVELGYRLDNARTTDPLALARVANGRGVEVLDARDASPCQLAGMDVGCTTLLVRLDYDRQGGLGGSTGGTGVECWRYTFRNSVGDHVPHPADCPDGAEPLVPPPRHRCRTCPKGSTTGFGSP